MTRRRLLAAVVFQEWCMVIAVVLISTLCHPMFGLYEFSFLLDPLGV